MNTRIRHFRPLGLVVVALGLLFGSPSAHAAKEPPPVPTPSTKPLEPGVIAVGNFIYAGNRSSVCFADKFLTDTALATTLPVEKSFRSVRLDADAVFDTPFCVFSGEGSFNLTERERANLRRYLLHGGFILASPSCSNADWDKSLRKELALALPEHRLVTIPMSHPIFSIVNKVTSLQCKTGNTALLEGLEVDGRIVMIYSKEGLNDVGNAKGCCCCGGNEIKASAQVNVNILTYALLY
jgi:hypothetical protein